MENAHYPDQIARMYDRMAAARPDPWRPGYHLSPLAGTLGDPDGLCQWDGTYHIFYVTSPLACATSQRTPCVWGHCTTRDFIHYRRETTALFPDTPRDRDGVYSGSGLVRDGRLLLYYTGNVRHPGNYDYIHAGREQNVLRAESADGIHFARKTLLMTNDDFPAWVTCHVRDPQVIEQDGRLLMLLGARTQADEGCALVYASEDGEHFRLVHTIRTPEPFGYMWECPDYAAPGGRPLLLCCPQGVPHQAYEYQNPHQCGCFELEGRLDAGARAGAFHSFDYGFDYYAVRSLRADDGRILLFGWMGMSEAGYGHNPTAARGWDQVLALPRELTWENGRPRQRPLRELRALRGACQPADPAAGCRWDSRRCELVLRPDPGQDLTLRLFEDGLLAYSAAEQVLTLDLSGGCGAGRTVRRMKLDRLETLDLFLDGSTVEAFLNDGEAVLTSRIFGESTTVTASPFAGRAECYPMGQFEIEDCREDGV